MNTRLQETAVETNSKKDGSCSSGSLEAGRTSGSAPANAPCAEVPGPLRITGADDWSASHDGLGTSSYCGIRDADGVVIALAVAHSADYDDLPNCRDIAERIVQCVNAHDEMVAALRRAKKVLELAAAGKAGKQHVYLESRGGSFVEVTTTLISIDAALSKVGVKP